MVNVDKDAVVINIRYRPAAQGDALPTIERITIIGGEQRSDEQAPALKIDDPVPFHGTSMTIDRTAGKGLTVFIVTTRGSIEIIESPVVVGDDAPLTHYGSLEVERVSDVTFPIGDTDSLWKLYEIWLKELPNQPEVRHARLEANRAAMRVLAQWCKADAEIELSRMRSRNDPNADRMSAQFTANIRSFTDATAPILDFGNYSTNDKANIKIDGEPRELEKRDLDRIYGRMQARYIPFGLLDQERR